MSYNGRFYSFMDVTAIQGDETIKSELKQTLRHNSHCVLLQQKLHQTAEIDNPSLQSSVALAQPLKALF